MKKVLIISGSPRKNGNSDLLCDEFLKGAKDSGNIVQKISLREKKVGYCVACDYCVSHNGTCAIKDDMSEIIEQMIDADVLVLASPVYFYSIDAQLKAVIDRCVAKYTQITNKEMYFIMTAAESDKSAFDGTLGCFRGFLDCISGATEKGVIYGGGAWKVGEIKSTKAMKLSYEMGKGV